MISDRLQNLQRAIAPPVPLCSLRLESFVKKAIAYKISSVRSLSSSSVFSALLWFIKKSVGVRVGSRREARQRHRSVHFLNFLAFSSINKNR